MMVIRFVLPSVRGFHSKWDSVLQFYHRTRNIIYLEQQANRNLFAELTRLTPLACTWSIRAAEFASCSVDGDLLPFPVRLAQEVQDIIFREAMD